VLIIPRACTHTAADPVISCGPNAVAALFGIGVHLRYSLSNRGDKAMPEENKPLVSIIMGSQSDWETMQHASSTLKDFAVTHESLIVSAHRTPAWLTEFATAAESRGIEVIIAGAGGAAHLPGMAAAQTLVPVLGVPVESQALKGMDSLLSIVQMPGGIPVATLAIGKAGAVNAALFAVAILSNSRPPLRDKLRRFRVTQSENVRQQKLP
jgi:5-(carboxyamino)imidazole ribonucleotide mutase